MRKQYASVIAAALALLGQQGPAVAQTRDVMSANAVVPGCRSFLANDNQNVIAMGACSGVISTIFYFSRTHFGVCLPVGANRGQAISVVVRYIDQRPERMHERFEDLALEALQQAWPCR
jgi:hypothetical protein